MISHTLDKMDCDSCIIYFYDKDLLLFVSIKLGVVPKHIL